MKITDWGRRSRKKLNVRPTISFRFIAETDSFVVVISRMQQINLVVDDINTQAKQMASAYEVSLDPFSPLFSKLLVQFPTEFDRYRLDEIVVAAIAPSVGFERDFTIFWAWVWWFFFCPRQVRRMITEWNPLKQPNEFLSTFRTWRRALKLNDVEEAPQTQVDVYGTKTFISPSSQACALPLQTTMLIFTSITFTVRSPWRRSRVFCGTYGFRRCDHL